MTDRELRAILEKGILAPSADNMQPWRFRIREDSIDLYLHQGDGAHFLEAGLLALYTSAGAVIENIRVAAITQGYRLVPSYFPEEKDLTWVASLHFEPSKEKGDPHFDALDARITNRKFYDLKKLNPVLCKELEQMALQEKGCRLLWIKKDDSRYLKIARLVGASDQLRYENQTIHREFIETVRFSESEEQITRDGLSLKSFEAGPGGGFLFKLIRSWKRLSVLNILGMSRLFNLYSVLQILSSGAVGLVVGNHSGSLNYVKGGQMMERLWLALTRENVAVQPMMALPIFIAASMLHKDDNFSAGQKEKLDKLKKEFYSLFDLNDQNSLVFLFRAGYAELPSARSLRRPLDSFLLEKAS